MKIVCLGSSSVEGIGDRRGIGWAGRLNEHLQQGSSISEHRVFNLGLKGEFLSGSIERYKTEALKRRPELVIIFTGSNDCVTNSKDDEVIKKPSPEKYSKLWDDFLTELHHAGHKTLVLGPTMVKEGILNYHGINITFKNQDLAEYNRTLNELCRTNMVNYLELFDLFDGELEKYGFDFVHPNEQGYDLIAEKLIKKLKDLNYV